MSSPENTPKPPKYRKPVTPRLIAVKALGRIFGLQEQLETAISDQPQYSGLEIRDRAFARLLVSSVIRQKGQIDQVLRGFVKRPPPDFVHNALRVGAAQLLVLGTSDHAAVGETVDLVKNHKKYYKFSGLVNAVLRKVAGEGAKKMAAIAPRENIPSWIYKSWEKAYGRNAARAMALQFMRPPPLDITVKSDPEGWAEKLGGEVLHGHTVRLPKAGQIQSLEGYEDGEWWVQDVASSLPVALDKSERRLEILKQNLERTGLKAEIVQADGTSWVSETDKFDIILLDAPCSATGTYRRHPDVLYAKTRPQIEKLQTLQQSLLRAATENLAPGGRLLYATCSLQPVEGEVQIADFVRHNPGYTVTPAKVENWGESLTKEGYLRILPHLKREKGGVDGFFFAILQSATKKP